jgi:hypothetical protein
MLEGRGAVSLLVACALACSPALAAAQDRPYALVFDSEMTPIAGAIDLLSLQRAAATIEDRWLPPARFDESTPFRRMLGIGYRLGKWFALDLPQDHFLTVVAHEISGHGARLREIGATSIHYRFDAPVPYGDGGGVTEFSGSVLATRADILAVDTGGIEAQNVLADTIGRPALLHGALHYREAWLYLEARLHALRYIRSVSPTSSAGHDVASFLRDFNDGCEPPACVPLDGPALKRRALLILADPLIAYSAYGWAMSYLVRGRTTLGVPMITLAPGIRYLPALAFELTPYGTEWSMAHNIATVGRLTRISVRVGDTGAERAWGVGVLATGLVRRGRVTAGFEGDVWQQPGLDDVPARLQPRTGGRAAATVQLSLAPSGPWQRAALVFQGGYKTDGFVRGERLHAGAVVRAGLSFTP